MRDLIRPVALTSLLLTILTVSSYAQKSVHFGVVAGANDFNVSGRSFDGKSKFGFSGGAYAELNLNSQWGLQPELLFNQVMTNATSDFSQIYPGSISSTVNLNYISLPVLAAFKPIPEITILLGPQYSYLVNQTSGLQGSFNPNADAFNKNDFSVLFGGQLNLGRVKIVARYSIGLNDIDARNSDTWKKHGLQMYVGYRIF